MGVTKAEINVDGELIFTYTNGTTANLGKIVGENGQDGNTPFIGENGNLWIGDTDTGVAAVAVIPAGSGAVEEKNAGAVVAIAIAGVSLLSNLLLILYIVVQKKKSLV